MNKRKIVISHQFLNRNRILFSTVIVVIVVEIEVRPKVFGSDD